MQRTDARPIGLTSNDAAVRLRANGRTTSPAPPAALALVVVFGAPVLLAVDTLAKRFRVHHHEGLRR